MIRGPLRTPKTDAYFSREQWEGVGEMLRMGASKSAVYRSLVAEDSMPYKSLNSFLNGISWAQYCGYLGDE